MVTQTKEEARQLTNFISQCFDALETYGKEPEQLKNMNAAFQLVLAPYTTEQVKSAFLFYLSNYKKIPVPSDIVSIIKRGNKPPFEKSVYVALVQKRERTSFKECGATYNCLTSDEVEYIRDYENFLINGG